MIRKKMKIVFLFLIRIYQIFISPRRGILRHFYFINTQCRFPESCSDFAYRVIKEKGSIRGMKLSLVRLSKCHSWSKRDENICDSS